MLEKYLEFAVAESQLVPCPATSVWSIVSDFDAIPKNFTEIDAILRIDGSKPGDPLRIGSKFRMDIRLGSGERWQSDLTVTALQVDGGEDGTKERKLTTYSEDMTGAGTVFSRTTIVESVSSDSCRVTLTMAIMPNRFFAVVGRMMCCWVYKRRAQKSLEQDLDDLVAAATALPPT